MFTLPANLAVSVIDKVGQSRVDGRLVSAGLTVAAALCFAACGSNLEDDDSPSEETPNGIEHRFSGAVEDAILQLSPEGEFPKPEDPTNRVSDDPRAIRLGQYLFYDKRLSGNGEINCASCHPPNHGFASPNRLAEKGVGTTSRHAPTLLNVAYNEWFFWDGRRDSLWSQAIVPLENPIEMAGSRLEVAHLVHDDPELREAYERMFEPLPDLSNTERFPPEGRPRPEQPDSPHHRAWSSMSEEDRQTINRVLANVMKCIAAFEMQLISLDAPFDTFVTGLRTNDPEKFDAISEKARKGAAIFAGRAGCVSCHDNPLFFDHGFRNLGLPDRPWTKNDDVGRYEGIQQWKENTFHAASQFSDAPNGVTARRLEILTRTSSMKGSFRTPTLRNVGKTPPYMHGGHFDTLREVVEFYNDMPPDEPDVGTRTEINSELNLSDAEIEQVVAFLRSLSGKPVPKKYKKPPSSPLLSD